MMKSLTAALALGLSLAATAHLRADIFGSGNDWFTIYFAPIGNPGNSDDFMTNEGDFGGPFGGVDYDYRIAVYEISHEMIAKATQLGMTNVSAPPFMLSGLQAAGGLTWYECAAFVNWLNTSKGYHAAYNLTYDTNSGWSMAL